MNSGDTVKTKYGTGVIEYIDSVNKTAKVKVKSTPITDYYLKDLVKINKYKVTLQLMVDPGKGDETIDKVYSVEAESEWEAYNKAEEQRDEGEKEFRLLSVFNYSVKELK